MEHLDLLASGGTVRIRVLGSNTWHMPCVTWNVICLLLHYSVHEAVLQLCMRNSSVVLRIRRDRASAHVLSVASVNGSSSSFPIRTTTDVLSTTNESCVTRDEVGGLQVLVQLNLTIRKLSRFSKRLKRAVWLECFCWTTLRRLRPFSVRVINWLFSSLSREMFHSCISFAD